MSRDHFRWDTFPRRHKRVRIKSTGRYGRVCTASDCGLVVENWHVSRALTQEVWVQSLDSRGTPKKIGPDFGEATDPNYKCIQCGAWYEECDWLELEVRKMPAGED